MIPDAVSLSRSPVGSSAHTMCGWLTKPCDGYSLALATRQLPGRCWALSLSPTSSKNSKDLFLDSAGLTPDTNKGIYIFPADRTGSRLYSWKTNPMRRAR
ncbi:MAG: hypothetical protein CM1200mP27_10250 [Chloroflexota bacterium]|nr:MAG: hypothetical protein CM1200mP27_10250 [Chloroflexota bacterium]